MNFTTGFIIFFSALSVRLTYIYLFGDAPDAFMTPDSYMYLEKAKNLYDAGSIFNLQEHQAVGLTDRVPGYLLFLIFVHHVIGDSQLYVVLIQAVVGSLTCVIATLLGRSIHHRLTIPVAVLAVFNLNLIIYSSLVLTDILFMLPFTASLWAGVLYIKNPSVKLVMVTAVLLAIALLIRPVIIYFPPVLIVLLLINAWHKGLSFRLVSFQVTAFSLCLAIIIGPIFLRNYNEFGHATYVSQTGIHALHWVYPLTERYANGIPQDLSIAKIDKRLKEYRSNNASPADISNPFAVSAEMKKIAFLALQELGVFPVIKAWVVGASLNVFGPSVLSSEAIKEKVRLQGFWAMHGNNIVERIWNYVTQSKAFMLIMLPAILLTISMRFLIAVSLAQLFIRRINRSIKWPDQLINCPQFLFLFIVAGYILGVTGPVVSMKYRIPIEPILDVLIAVGLLWVLDYLRLRMSKRVERN